MSPCHPGLQRGKDAVDRLDDNRKRTCPNPTPPHPPTHGPMLGLLVQGPSLKYRPAECCLVDGTGSAAVLEVECIPKTEISVSHCIPSFGLVYHVCIPTFKSVYHMCLPPRCLLAVDCWAVDAGLRWI